MKKNSYEIDMVHGPILGKMLVFAFPLMLSSILQLLFNAADVVVVGRFAGSAALAAVGSTSALINLLINVFVGVSIGANVLVARYLGARDFENTSETVHTSILVALVSGCAAHFHWVLFIPATAVAYGYAGRRIRHGYAVYAHILCWYAGYHAV